jgi:hypothetical protein
MIAAILAIGAFIVAVIGTWKDYRAHPGQWSILGINRYGVALVSIAAIMMFAAII